VQAHKLWDFKNSYNREAKYYFYVFNFTKIMFYYIISIIACLLLIVAGIYLTQYQISEKNKEPLITCKVLGRNDQTYNQKNNVAFFLPDVEQLEQMRYSYYATLCEFKISGKSIILGVLIADQSYIVIDTEDVRTKHWIAENALEHYTDLIKIAIS